MAREGAMRSLMAALLLVSAAAALTAQPVPKIAPRDQLTIVVFGVEALSGKFPVGTDGSITFPHIGAVLVAGLSARDLEVDLTTRLRDGGYLLNPQVTVELQQTPNKRVIITGAVRSPGQLPYAGELTLLEALALAGSTTVDAGDLVLIVRAGAGAEPGADPLVAADAEEHDGVIELSLSALESGGLAEHNVALNDGDHIVVPRAQQVFISGHVRSPGAYSVQGGTTVLQAVTLAGGLTERGTFRGIRIIRDKQEVKNVTRDSPVRPGDTIIVRASPF